MDFRDNAYDALQGADGVVILTEWNEFRALDFAQGEGRAQDAPDGGFAQYLPAGANGPGRLSLCQHRAERRYAMILITGAAGFIGSHVAHALLARGETVLGIDNLNDYYDVSFKQARLLRLESEKQFTFRKIGYFRPGWHVGAGQGISRT